MAFDVVLMKKNVPVAPAQISLHDKSEACIWSMIHLSHVRDMMNTTVIKEMLKQLELCTATVWVSKKSCC